MHRTLRGAGLFLFLACGAAGGQESAYFGGYPAARFEQTPGVFHYMFSCQPTREMAHLAQIASKPPADPEPALCWPVWALRMTKNGATFDASPAVNGKIMVTAHLFRFIPITDKDAGLYAEFRPDEIDIEHKAGQAFAFFGTKDVFYKFGFINVCTSCQNGQPAPPTADTAQLDREFETVRDGIRHFDTAQQQITALGAKIRVEIRPDNQPGTSDIPESLKLYADLNERFAELCAEPAKACIRSFAAFEKCKSAGWGTECGAWPACSVGCVISTVDLRKLNADACVQFNQSGASLSPDWSEVVRAKKTNQLPTRTFAPGVVELQTAPGPNPPSAVGCGVSASFERASMPSNAFGVAGMEGLGGTQGSSHLPNNITMAAPRKVNISPGVAQGMLLKKVAPGYPLIAKAAGVQGTVVLQATISKTGEITDLQVVSGPPLLLSSALDAVKQWQYRPYLLNGEAVQVLTTINVIFALGNPLPAASPQGAAQAPPPPPR